MSMFSASGDGAFHRVVSETLPEENELFTFHLPELIDSVPTEAVVFVIITIMM